MAGAVRQPIDVGSLSKYLEGHVREIQLPISLKQVGLFHRKSFPWGAH